MSSLELLFWELLLSLQDLGAFEGEKLSVGAKGSERSLFPLRNKAGWKECGVWDPLLLLGGSKGDEGRIGGMMLFSATAAGDA